MEDAQQEVARLTAAFTSTSYTVNNQYFKVLTTNSSKVHEETTSFINSANETLNTWNDTIRYRETDRRCEKQLNEIKAHLKILKQVAESRYKEISISTAQVEKDKSGSKTHKDRRDQEKSVLDRNYTPLIKLSE